MGISGKSTAVSQRQLAPRSTFCTTPKALKAILCSEHSELWQSAAMRGVMEDNISRLRTRQSKLVESMSVERD